MRKVRETKAGTLVPPQRRDPPPMLPRDCESDLVAWITAMQQDGHPVDRHMILIKGNQLTIDVGGRILTLALLHDIDKSKAERAEATKLKLVLRKKRAAKRKGKRAPKKAKRATGATSTDSSDYESPQSDEDDIVDSVVV
ncbi:hypothetical protein DYB26_010919 [Aphanomyces astaci]|uniref:HTH CENPB-type domain-containing protein n=1 Tax=Aphanomyces astaci TaxID=112090 RepID=A0A397FPC1_APHAT|nr:hypothetical protein DYB31_012437 [Aphanomyces astaci]RHZ39255.1 hypothetical protein DYB26_010919 [Aphanomyces astaci]